WHYQRTIGGELVGPDGPNGFNGIRRAFEEGWDPQTFMILIWTLLAATLLALMLFERSRTGIAVRGTGEDPVLARLLGADVARLRVSIAGVAGAIAGLGGGLYAHLNTYIEPRLFDVMLGVHALAYGLIGGLGTALGALIGVLLDIGILESSRLFHGWRMVVFGGLVALLLIWRPRGLLDEATIRRLRALVFSGRRHAWGGACDGATRRNDRRKRRFAPRRGGRVGGYRGSQRRRQELARPCHCRRASPRAGQDSLCRHRYHPSRCTFDQRAWPDAPARRAAAGADARRARQSAVGRLRPGLDGPGARPSEGGAALVPCP